MQASGIFTFLLHVGSDVSAELSCCLLNPSVPYNTEFLSRDKEFCSHLIAISFSYVIT